jgi:hypothetical protein
MLIKQCIAPQTAARLSLLLFSVLITLVAGSIQAGSLEPLNPLDKSPERAVRASLLSTVIPIVAGGGLLWAGLKSEGNYEILTGVGAVTGFLGITVGPSVGHSYAESPGKGAKGIGIRMATSLVGGFLTFISVNEFEVTDAPAKDRNNAAVTMGVLLFGVTAISAIHDIVSAGKSAERYNRRHASASIQIAPAYFANSGAPGLALRIGF